MKEIKVLKAVQCESESSGVSENRQTSHLKQLKSR